LSPIKVCVVGKKSGGQGPGAERLIHASCDGQHHIRDGCDPARQRVPKGLIFLRHVGSADRPEMPDLATEDADLADAASPIDAADGDAPSA